MRNARMKNAALTSVNKNIYEMLCNIDVWTASLDALLNVRKHLVGKTHLDIQLRKLINQFGVFKNNYATYLDEVVNDNDEEYVKEVDENDVEENDEEYEVEDYETNKTKSHPNKSKLKTAPPDDEEELDKFLQRAVQSTTQREWTNQETRDKTSWMHEFPGKGPTKEQQAAMNILSVAEQEQEEMNALIDQRRKRLEEESKKPPPSSPVRFTMDIDKTLDPKTGLPIPECMENADEDEEVIDEEEIEEDVIEEEEIEEEDESISNKITKATKQVENAVAQALLPMTNDKSLHPLIAMQQADRLLSDLGNPAQETYAPAPTQNSTPSQSSNRNQPPAQTQTPAQNSEHISEESRDLPSDFDPRFAPLYRMTIYQRNKLYNNWFKRAVINVDEQLKNKTVAADERAKMIREETSRLRDAWLESQAV